MCFIKAKPKEIQERHLLIEIENRIGKCKNCRWHPEVCKYCRIKEDVKRYHISYLFVFSFVVEGLKKCFGFLRGREKQLNQLE